MAGLELSKSASPLSGFPTPGDTGGLLVSGKNKKMRRNAHDCQKGPVDHPGTA
jgi:hypothetical protein